MIKSIKYRNEEFSYPVFEFLYPYLIKLVWRNKLETEVGGVLIIKEETSVEFKLLLKELLNQLLDEFYEEPQERDLVEFKGRYEQIELNGNKYKLNIATNGKDRVAFQVFSLLAWFETLT